LNRLATGFFESTLKRRFFTQMIIAAALAPLEKITSGCRIRAALLVRLPVADNPGYLTVPIISLG